MSSSPKMASLAFAGVVSLSLLSAEAQAQAPDRGSLENYQGGGGRGKKCGGGHTGVPASREARLRTGKRPDQSAAVSSLQTVTKPTPMQPGTPDEVATRQLNLARDLRAEADLALQSKELAKASKLRERVEERLTQLLEKYPQTDAANQATILLAQYRDN